MHNPHLRLLILALYLAAICLSAVKSSLPWRKARTRQAPATVNGGDGGPQYERPGNATRFCDLGCVSVFL